MAAPDANGNKRTVVNPEAVQCHHREIGTDKSASRQQSVDHCKGVYQDRSEKLAQ
jgi:hypothetical protein